MIFFKLQLALGAIITATHAFESISVPAAITADQPFTLTTTTNDSDSAYTSYRVYLDTTPPGYTGGPSCYLQNTTSISQTSLDLTIPADFGPDGSFYSISTREFPDSSSYTSSATFTLSGATGNWSEYENKLSGSPLWPADDLPCSAYACARNCAMASYPDDLTSGSDAYKTMSSCILDCAGVSVPATTSSSSVTSGTSATASVATATGSGVTTSTRASGSATSTKATGSATESASDSATASGSGSVASSTGAAFVNEASVALVAAGGFFALFL